MKDRTCIIPVGRDFMHSRPHPFLQHNWPSEQCESFPQENGLISHVVIVFGNNGQIPTTLVIAIVSKHVINKEFDYSM